MDLTGGDGGTAPINPRLVVSLSPINSGVGGKILGAKRPKFGAEGAVLENFSDKKGHFSNFCAHLVSKIGPLFDFDNCTPFWSVIPPKSLPDYNVK